MDHEPDGRADSEQPTPPGNGEEKSAVPPGTSFENAGYDREDGTLRPSRGTEIPPGYAHYPRYSFTGYGPIPPGPPIVRFTALSEAWELMRQDLATYALAMVIYVAVALAVNQVASILLSPLSTITPSMDIEQMVTNPSLWMLTSLSTIVLDLAMFVLGAGYFSICLRRLRGETFSVGNLFDGFKFIWPLLIAAVVTTFLRIAGMLLLVAPGIFVSGALAFVPLIIIDQKTGAFEAIRLSYLSTKKDMLMMGLLCTILASIATAGCCGCVLVFLSGPIYYMAIAIHYHAYFPPQGGPQEIPAIEIAPQYSV